MKLWIDECLTPALVGQAHDRGYEATCTRDRGRLGLPDDELIVLAVDEGFAFVTNNDADFRGLCAAAELHAGLVVSGLTRAAQRPVRERCSVATKRSSATRWGGVRPPRGRAGRR